MENGNGKSTGETLETLKAKYEAMEEGIERKIVEVQADTLKLREENARFREMITNAERRVDLVEYTQDRDEERLLRVEEVGPYLIQMLNRQEERLDLARFEREALRADHRELDEKMKELAATHKETGERLNAFIVVLESYIQENRQRRNGENKDHD